MPKAEFFSCLGLLTIRNFLERELCEELKRAIQAKAIRPATILGKDGQYLADETVRSTQFTKLTELVLVPVTTRLQALKSRLNEHFQVLVNEFEPPQCLWYQAGDFYRPHTDRSRQSSAPVYVQSRQVSVVIFLNSQAEVPTEECYGGGTLAFYGLIDDPLWQKYGFELQGEAGLLVAFPSQIVHEVRPVAWGDRYTIATWFS